MSQYAQDIHRILASLNEPENDEEATASALLPDEQEVHVIHVYPVEGGGILFSQTELEPEQAPVIDSQEQKTRPTKKAHEPPLFLSFFLILCFFLLFDAADSQLLTLMTPTATVTILPKAKTVTTTADLPAAAIQAHLFASLTLSMSQAVPATGTGHQDARQATGTVTFYNGQQNAQTVALGTVFTGSDGVNIATTESATIPAGNPNTGYGTVTVTAQALQAGSRGNIQAGDVNTAIALAVFVKNSQFRNGQDARTFPIVTKEDIEHVVTQLTPRLVQSEQAAFTSQLQTGEQLFPPTCTPLVTSSRQPGDEATQVRITVSETCSAGAYNQQAVQEQGMQVLHAKAGTLGKSYSLVGDIHTALLAKQDAATIRVQFTGTYLYQINQQELTTLIAGQPKQQAIMLLTKLPGIQQATIAGIADNNQLPLDTTHIHIILLYAVSEET